MKSVLNFVLVTTAIPITWGLLTTESLAASFLIAQESAPGLGDFDEVIPFQVKALSDKTKTLKQLYDYSNFSYNGTGKAILNPENLTRATSHFFMVEAIDGIGLFFVHDKPGATASGGQLRTEFQTLNSMGSFAVLDDPIDNYTVSTMIGDPTMTSTLTAYQGWLNPFTDGGVIKWDYLQESSSLIAKFTQFDPNIGGNGIYLDDWKWRLFSQGKNGVQRATLDFELNRAIKITPLADALPLSLEVLETLPSTSDVGATDIVTSDISVTGDVGVAETIPEPSLLFGLFMSTAFVSLVSRKNN